MELTGQHILITGAAKRIGRAIGLYLASKGANISLHYGQSKEAAKATQKDIQSHGVDCWLLQADLADAGQASSLVERAEKHEALSGLINNASIFGDQGIRNTELDNWQKHLAVNLSAPFFISQSLFLSAEKSQRKARIINILDWRALRPRDDHLAYTVCQTAMAGLTQSLAIAMAPRMTVNGIALGAILPPSDGENTDSLIDNIPLKRWAKLEELGQSVEFLIGGPEFITGEIIHLDGGRHLI